MSLPSIIIIAIGLGMDAFSVAIGIGAASQNISVGSAFRLSFHFGLFQSLMPVIGWFSGMTVAHSIAGFDHWVVFGLLSFVGGKMIVESFRSVEKICKADPTRGFTLLILSVVTSIDALAVGLSFALLKINILYPCLIIGVVAFVMTMIGMVFGSKLGTFMGKYAGTIGGIILIGIGVKILMEHLL
jgi:putative Mn2+ efflux pump MntP